MIDYGFHQIITDPTDEVILREDAGDRRLRHPQPEGVPDLRPAAPGRPPVPARAGRGAPGGALVTVHCENHDAIAWRTEALLAAGLTAPKYHAWSRPPVVEREATYRAIALAELVDQPIQVFHVSCAEVAEEIARAQARGLKVWGETCPQYLVLTAADMDRPGFEGAKFMCSPAPRTGGEHERLGGDPPRHARRGLLRSQRLQLRGQAGKRANGDDAPFRDIPNGVPGLGSRLAAGVQRGRGEGAHLPTLRAADGRPTPQGCSASTPRKGTIAPGSDADLVLWDPARRVDHHQRPDAARHRLHALRGLEVTGWPVATVRRGDVVMRDGDVQAEPGSGRFLPRGPYG